MELKKYVRKGIISESRSYQPVLQYDGGPPEQVLLLLEGKCRRKLHLGGNRFLYENYYPVSLIGLEDCLLGRSRTGGAGFYPGSHYVLWNTEDLLSAVTINPELAQRAVFELSRRIRVYDSHKKVTDTQLRQESSVQIGPPQDDLKDTLYELSFSDDDDFSPHLTERLSRKFDAGEEIMRQGDATNELHIIMEGEARVTRRDESESEAREIDVIGTGEFLGEMAQFDGLPRSASAHAVGPVRTLAFKPENFHLLFTLHPRWCLKLLHSLADRIDKRLSYFEKGRMESFNMD